MRTFILIALAIFAFAAVAHAEDDTDEFNSHMMQCLTNAQKFFNDDSVGSKLKELAQKTSEFIQELKMKARAVQRKYIQDLLEEN
ncbi:hypothetical protein ACTXT7_016489 [Hymenolepis weldensis]